MADTATIADFEKAHRAPAPRAPMTIEETGLGADQVSHLFVKTLYTGEATGVEVADRLRLSYQMLEPLVEQMRAERLIEVRGTTGQGSASYRYALTDLGRDRARSYLDANSYVGRALGGDLYVPYGIDVNGETITVYDPVAHESLEAQDEGSAAHTALVTAAPRDRRWVRIRRPVVIVGGELTLEMLDLTFNPIAK